MARAFARLAGRGKYIAGGAAALAGPGFVLCEQGHAEPGFLSSFFGPKGDASKLAKDSKDPYTFFSGLPKGQSKQTLPTLSLEEVRADHGDDVWVTYNGGVYNMTPFLDAHPGGTGRIEMVSGSDLKAYWDVYTLHHRPHIKALLEEFRVGNLSPEDQAKVEAESHFANGYTEDPQRVTEGVRAVSVAPYNHETELSSLVNSFYTPNELFFVRNHNAVPEVKKEDWTLEIAENKELGIEAQEFTLDDLKTKFERVEVVAALQCAGNRQEDYVTPDRPLYVAPHWQGGAIGCAKWAGVRVRDVLGAAGLPVDAMALGRINLPGAQIVNFEGLDTDETGTPYAGVVPVAKCIDPFGDTILAYEMNGETLPRDHGYPVRCLAPGTGGCRNVKWVKNISVTAKPSELDSGSKLDRHFANTISWSGHREHVAEDRVPGYKTSDSDGCQIKLEAGPVIQTLPVQSVLCWPPNRSSISAKPVVRDGFVEIQGVAYSGAGRGVARVEVSLDDGDTFHPADLQLNEDSKVPPPEFGCGRNWAWVLFKAKIPVPPAQLAKLQAGQAADLQVCSKAIDGDFNSQPESMRSTWNVLGICVNHWARSTVTVDPSLPETHRPKPTATPAPGAYWLPEEQK